MIADMHPDLKAGAVVRRLECGEHFKEVIEHVRLARKDAPTLLSAGKFRQHLGHVIGHSAVVNVGASQDISHQHVEV